MRLLILTQKVDINDPILGFFHRWIEEFVKHCERMTVIALGVGEYDLPKNVNVFTLGKEQGVSRFRYVYNFYRLIWRERKNYDAVFVHMNQEYVLLGGLLWKLLGKKVTMWRNHAKGSLATRAAVLFSDKVFCTSPHSFTAQFRKTKIMPVGVDTNFFKADSSVSKKLNSILFLGRISSVKNVHIFVEALKDLRDKEIKFSATIAGGPSSKEDIEYETMIRDKVTEYGLEKQVLFVGAVSQFEALRLYREHALYVNLTPSGSMDKTIFEAMACESLVLVYNDSLKSDIIGIFLVNQIDERNISSKLRNLLFIDVNERVLLGQGLREVVLGKHSLVKLSTMLMVYIKK